MPTDGRVAIVTGATGLVGRHLIAALLPSEAPASGGLRVVSYGRRPLESLGARAPAFDRARLEERVVELETLDAAQLPDRVDEAYCCLGTTIGRAGSQAAFRTVDHEMPLQFARAALARGARRFALVSSLGADPRSRIFYSRVKGELERDLRSLGLERLVILRPSLLLGERDELRRGERFAERFAGVTSWALVGPLRRYRPIHARVVARAMIAALREATPGVTILPSDALAELGAR
ncbi:MAG: NAD(P)H-binding protein [Myxococcales bacterium]|nr:NAD(P)H-binding protein [Myxococcales bacterium]